MFLFWPGHTKLAIGYRPLLADGACWIAVGKRDHSDWLWPSKQMMKTRGHTKKALINLQTVICCCGQLLSFTQAQDVYVVFAVCSSTTFFAQTQPAFVATRLLMLVWCVPAFWLSSLQFIVDGRSTKGALHYLVLEYIEYPTSISFSIGVNDVVSFRVWIGLYFFCVIVILCFCKPIRAVK